MTLSLPRNHTIETRINAESQTELRLDDGPWTRSTIASIHKLNALWLDTEDIVFGWYASTGQRIGHICEGCGVRSIEARVVDGSDEWWCRGCRS